MNPRVRATKPATSTTPKGPQLGHAALVRARLGEQRAMATGLSRVPATARKSTRRAPSHLTRLVPITLKCPSASRRSSYGHRAWLRWVRSCFGYQRYRMGRPAVSPSRGRVATACPLRSGPWPISADTPLMGRPPLTTGEARALLSIKERRTA